MRATYIIKPSFSCLSFEFSFNNYLLNASLSYLPPWQLRDAYYVVNLVYATINLGATDALLNLVLKQAAK